MDEKTLATLQNLPNISKEEATKIAKKAGIKDIEQALLESMAGETSGISNREYIEDLARRRAENYLKKQELESASKAIPKLSQIESVSEKALSSAPDELVRDINIGEYQKLKQAESLAQQAARKGALGQMMSGTSKALKATPAALLSDIVLNPSEVASEEEEMKERQRLIRERMKK